MFMRYVHNEEDLVRTAAAALAARRCIVVGAEAPVAEEPSTEVEIEVDAALETADVAVSASPPAGLEGRKYSSRTKVGNCRPFRHRNRANRATRPAPDMMKTGRQRDERAPLNL